MRRLDFLHSRYCQQKDRRSQMASQMRMEKDLSMDSLRFDLGCCLIQSIRSWVKQSFRQEYRRE
jgi:hypothetical protein